ncbi:hypothetical protein MTP99_015026 [Tenebrio molitor]|jgi:hypothetical protein|nr:hypothetical protein MTP99_015026 [Tenebrio molitor]
MFFSVAIEQPVPNSHDVKGLLVENKAEYLADVPIVLGITRAKWPCTKHALVMVSNDADVVQIGDDLDTIYTVIAAS